MNTSTVLPMVMKNEASFALASNEKRVLNGIEVTNGQKKMSSSM